VQALFFHTSTFFLLLVFYLNFSLLHLLYVFLMDAIEIRDTKFLSCTNVFDLI